MFPLISEVPRYRFAYGVLLLILVNIGVHLYFMFYPNILLFADFGFSPIKLSLPSEIVTLSDKIIPFFTYSFIHTNIIHLIFNMVNLFLFGINVENKIGFIRFLIFYILYGIFGVICESIVLPNSNNIILGSSSAIAGIMGMYFIFHPISKIKTYVPLRKIISVPAVIYILFFIALQFGLYFGEKEFNISSYIEKFQLFIGLNEAYIRISNVSIWSPVGGFISGIFFGILTAIVIYFRTRNKANKQIKNESNSTNNNGEIEYVVTKSPTVNDFKNEIVVTVDNDFNPDKDNISIKKK